MSILETLARTEYDGIVNVNPALVDWREIESNPGNYIKVLNIDEGHHRVDFLFRQDPLKRFTRHNHRCVVATVTLQGEWGYLEGEEKLFEGCYAYDPPGTAHTPYATEQGMVVFASFHGTDPVFLDYLDEDGKVTGHMDLDWFKSYADS